MERIGVERSRIHFVGSIVSIPFDGFSNLGRTIGNARTMVNVVM